MCYNLSLAMIHSFTIRLSLRLLAPETRQPKKREPARAAARPEPAIPGAGSAGPEGSVEHLKTHQQEGLEVADSHGFGVKPPTVWKGK